MKTVFKVLAGLLILLLLAAFAALAAVATNVRAMEFVIRQVFRRTAPEVQSFQIRTLYYSFPSSWVLGRVSATVLAEDKPVKVFIEQLELSDLTHLLTTGATVRINLRGADAAVDQLKVRGGSCTVDLSRSTNGFVYAGSAGLVQVQQQQLQITEIKAEFSGDERSAALTNLTAEVYGGALSGHAQIVFGPPPVMT